MYQFISIYANAREYWVDSQALPLVCSVCFVTALYGAPCICRLSDSQWSYDSCASAIRSLPGSLHADSILYWQRPPIICQQPSHSISDWVDIFEFEPCGKTSIGNIFLSWDLGD